MPRSVPPTAAALTLVAGTAVATSSVVRYRLWIVAVYVVLAAVLAASLLLSGRRGRPAGPALTRPAAVLALAAVALAYVTVRPYTYLSAADGWSVRWAFFAAAVLGALLLAVPAPAAFARRAPDVALGVAVVAFLGTAAALIHLDPAPKIDVWVTLQQASDAIADGRNIYSQQWTGSPGVQDAFTYLPFTALLLAPGRWLAGDVRWALVAVTVLAALLVRALPGRDAPSGRRVAATAAAALLLLLPGTPTQVEQAWTEPLLLACLAGWALGVARGRTWLAVGSLALGLACKQHLVLLLPLLAAWPRFGPRRTIAAAALGGAFVLPWFLASPADMWHDTVSMLVQFQPLVFADTLYIAAINELGWTPPFWLTGFAVLGTLAAATVAVRRRDPDLATVLRWAALVLFVANLVNKQAFYNQYWLVAALVLVSWAVPRDGDGPTPGPATDQAGAGSTGEPGTVPARDGRPVSSSAGRPAGPGA